MPTQYCKCVFRDGDKRAYTYANDGEPVAPGDFVKVEDSRDPTAWKKVRVIEVSEQVPNFACKPVLGRIDDAEIAADGDFLREMAK